MKMLCDEYGRAVAIPVVDRGERRNKFVSAIDVGVQLEYAFVIDTNENEDDIVEQMLAGYKSKVPEATYDYLRVRSNDVLRALNNTEFANAVHRQYGVEMKNGIAFSAAFTYTSATLRVRKRCEKKLLVSVVKMTKPESLPQMVSQQPETPQQIHSPRITKKVSSKKPGNSSAILRKISKDLPVVHRIQKDVAEIRAHEKKIEKMLRG